MRAIFLLSFSVFLLTASTACAQVASGMAGGWGRGSGLHGVTRRTYMGVPNVVAARYFQNSGLPLVNPQNVNTTDPTGGTRLAANGSRAGASRPGQPARPAAVLVQRTPPPKAPIRPTSRGLARVGP